MPTNKDVLFWSISQRDAAFRAMEQRFQNYLEGETRLVLAEMELERKP